MICAAHACLVALLLGQPTVEVPATWRPPTGFVEETAGAPPPTVTSAFASERAWTRQAGDWTEHVVQVLARKPVSLRRYLAHWRARHACALRPEPTATGLSWAGDEQSTWSGTCEGGDVFVMHVARLGDSFFEFHVGRRLGLPRADGTSAPDEALRRLLGAISDPRGWPVLGSSRPRRAFSRAEARQRLLRLPMVRSLRTPVRLRPVEDAAEIGLLGCTGSAGECLYWFRAETRMQAGWEFWRWLGFSPYDGAAYLSTTKSLAQVQGGRFERVGGQRPHRSSSGRVERHPGAPRAE